MNTSRNASRARTAFALLLLGFVAWPVAADWSQGVDAFKAGRFQDAAAEFRVIVEQSPDAPEGHFMLGLSLLRADQAEGSLAPLARAVELGNSDPRYRLALGQAQLQAGKPDLALTTLAAQDPSAVPAASREVYGKLLVKAASESRRPDVALAALEKAAGAGRSKTLWLAAAHVADKSGDGARAFAALDTAYGLDRGDAETGRRAVLKALAVAQGQSADGARQSWYGKGFEVARQWAEASPSAEAYLLAGQAKMGAKDYAGAHPWLAKAAAAAADDPVPLYHLSRCALALEKPEPDAALQHVARALALSPDAELRRQLLEARGTAYHHREEFDKAAAAYREAGNAEKTAEMEGYAEAQRQNERWEQERKKCRDRVATLSKLMEESKNLEGTDAWKALVADYDEATTACAEYLKDDG